MHPPFTNDETRVFRRFAAYFHLDLDLAQEGGVKGMANGFVFGRDKERLLLKSALQKALEHCVHTGDLTRLFVDACAEQLPEEDELNAGIRAWLNSSDAPRALR